MNNKAPRYRYEQDPTKVISKRQKVGVGLGLATAVAVGIPMVINNAAADLEREVIPASAQYKDHMTDLEMQKTRNIIIETRGKASQQPETTIQHDDKGNTTVDYPSSEQGFTVTVQAGDSPYGLADRFATDELSHDRVVDEIQKEMGPDGLQPGEQLHLGDTPVKSADSIAVAEQAVINTERPYYNPEQ